MKFGVAPFVKYKTTKLGLSAISGFSIHSSCQIRQETQNKNRCLPIGESKHSIQHKWGYYLLYRNYIYPWSQLPSRIITTLGNYM